MNAAQVGVTVSDGVVTLRGTVATLQEKWTAERSARQLVGVRAVANDLSTIGWWWRRSWSRSA